MITASLFVKEIFHLYSSNFHEDTIWRNVIVQSDPDQFWKILLNEIFDLFTDKITLTFAGEAEADAGWLFREFLTLSMKYFAKWPDSSFLALKAVFSLNRPQINRTEQILYDIYYILDQPTVLGVLYTGRGPQCLHVTLGQAMYNQEITICTPIDDIDLQGKLQSIKNGSHEYLFGHNINWNDSPKSLQRFFILTYRVDSRYQAIA